MSGWDAPSYSDGDGGGSWGAAPSSPAKETWVSNPVESQTSGGYVGNSWEGRSRGDASGGASGDSYGGGGGDSYGGGDRACHNCGQEGHISRDCTEPRKPAGACRKCGEEGHFARECPSRGPDDDKCRRCGENGHFSRDCTQPAPTEEEDEPARLSATEAWALLLEKDKEGEMDELRDAFEQYAKASPNETFLSIESKLREAGCKTFIIAYDREVENYNTFTNLQKEPDQKYLAAFSRKKAGISRRPPVGAPSGPEENLERLASAGFVRPVKDQYCINCKSRGHAQKDCPEPRREIEKKETHCYNCEESGHRTRDCKQERKQRGGPIICNLCNEEGHKRADCSQNTGGGGRACYNCGEDGHISRECPEPRKPRD